MDRPKYDCTTMGHISIAGEDNCRACGQHAPLMCQACGIRKAVGVASSAWGAISLAYCRECLRQGADAQFVIEGLLATCGSWEHVAEGARLALRFWRPCERCGGSGEEPQVGGDCLRCHGGQGDYVYAVDAYSEDDVKRLAREMDEAMMGDEGAAT